jgi:hypothetical protein
MAVDKHVEYVGDGTSSAFHVRHELDTIDVIVQVWQSEVEGELVQADIGTSGPNAVNVMFADAPRSGEFKVVVIG